MLKSLRNSSLLAMAAASVLHLIAAPQHMAHMTVHGLALLVFGVLQVAWVAIAWRWWTRITMLIGIALSVGLILLWALLYGTPTTLAGHLASHVRQFDAILIATKLLEGVAGASLIAAYGHVTDRTGGRWRASVAGVTMAAIVSGMLLWLSAIGVQARLPLLSASSGWPTRQMLTELRAVQTSPVTNGNTTYDWRLPHGFPLPRVPEDNSMSAEKVELGRYLFYDKRLSGNGTQSCESCHLQKLAFSDGKRTPVGSTGQMLERNSPALVNVAYNATLTWANPTLTEVERQVLVPMFAEFPVEMGMTGRQEEVLNRLRSDKRYQQFFATAFPDDPEPINIHNVIQALSSFIRSLISGNSPYDHYVAGHKSALSVSAQRGMELFFGEELECHHCHTGFNFSSSTIHANSTFSAAVFQNNGLYNLDGEGAYPLGNRGVYEITGKPDDMGRFRPPTLRNIALTAPYMHDGSIATLEEVVRHYMAGGRIIEEGPLAGDGRRNPHKNGLVSGFELTDQEIADLVAFLESLTDENFINNPLFSNPFNQVNKLSSN